MAGPVRVFVAVNPASGGSVAAAAPAVIDVLRGAGLSVRVVAAPDEGATRVRVVEELDRGGEALVVVGGDGLVNLAVDVLAGRSVPLGIVPAGTGNDAARELGVPLDDPAAAARLVVDRLEGPRRLIDVGLVESTPAAGPVSRRRFLCAVSAGFDALVNERADAVRFPRGRHRYTAALLLELAGLRERRYVVTVDGEARRFGSVLLAVANLGSIGGGMRIVPFASPEDGRLDVISVAPVSRLRFLLLFPRVFSGRHTTLDIVSIRRGRVVTIECDEPIVAYADGERIGPAPLRISIEERSLAILAEPILRSPPRVPYSNSLFSGPIV